jgi:hypothetical protein
VQSLIGYKVQHHRRVGRARLEGLVRTVETPPALAAWSFNFFTTTSLNSTDTTGFSRAESQLLNYTTPQNCSLRLAERTFVVKKLRLHAAKAGGVSARQWPTKRFHTHVVLTYARIEPPSGRRSAGPLPKFNSPACDVELSFKSLSQL